MTFTHEGNRTLLDTAGLVNFEKMHMLAQTMRTLRYCRSRSLCNCKAFNFIQFLRINTIFQGFLFSNVNLCLI